MAIKIPRGSQPEVRLPTTNTLGVAANNPVSRSFDKLTSFLDVVATRKAENDRRIEAQRIKNKNTLNKSILVGDVNQVLENVRNNKELSTSSGETYNKYWDGEVVKLKTKYKKLYKDDDKAYEQFLSDFHLAIETGQKDMWKLRNEQVLVESQVSYDLEHLDVLNQIDSLTVDENIWTKFAPIFEQKKKAIIDILKINKNYVSDVDSVLFDLKVRVWEKIFEAEAGSITSPNGEPVVNWKAYYTNLTALSKEGDEYKVYGEFLTKHMRTELIKKAKVQLEAQDSVFSAMRTENERKSETSFTNQIVAIASNSKEGIEFSKDFLERLEKDNTLESDTKRTLKKAYDNALKVLATGVSTWDSPAGLKIKATLTYLVEGGFIDTKGERMMILDAMAEGYIKPEYATTLINASEKNTVERHKYKNGLIRNAGLMLSRKLNIDENILTGIIEQMTEMQELDPDKTGVELLHGIFAANKYPLEAYAAINQMFSMIAVGESKNFKIEEMLMDEKSENYIMNDLVNVYGARVNEEVRENWKGILNEDEALSVSTLTSGGTDYVFNTQTYWKGKVPEQPKLDLPTKNDGETVIGYIKRVQKITKAEGKKYLSEWQTGEFTTDSLDATQFIIIPDSAE
jgi:hypothetical protein